MPGVFSRLSMFGFPLPTWFVGLLSTLIIYRLLRRWREGVAAQQKVKQEREKKNYQRQQEEKVVIEALSESKQERDDSQYANLHHLSASALVEKMKKGKT